jgi:O-antigen ligase
MVTFEAGVQRYLPAETLQPLVWLGLFFGLSALPVALVYSTRSSPTFLALACVMLFADEYRRNPRFSRLRGLARGFWGKPMILPLILLAALGMASAVWSAAPGHTFQTALQFAGSLLLGIAWVALVARFRREHVLPFLAGGLAAALILLPFELLHPSGIRGFFTDNLMAYEHNRTLVQLSVLATLFVALSAQCGYPLWRAWAAALLIGLLIMLLVSESQSAFAYWLAVALAALAAGWAPRATLKGVAIATGLIVLAFPWAFLLWHQPIADLLIALVPEDFARAAHVEQRILIWTEFARIVTERLWLGWGMQAERAIDLTVIPGDAAPAYSPHHPHSLPLELWTGLGIAGAALAVAVLVGFARLVLRYPDVVVGWTASLFTGIFAVWLVSHGAWESWWLAMLPLSLGTLLAIDFYPADGPPIAAS